MTTILIYCLLAFIAQFLIILSAILITDARPFNIKNTLKAAKLIFTKPISIPFLIPFLGFILLVWEGFTSEHR